MTVVVVLVALVVLFVVWRRRRRASRLAGLDAGAPVFSVEPPRRRLSGIKGERL